MRSGRHASQEFSDFRIIQCITSSRGSLSHSPDPNHTNPVISTLSYLFSDPAIFSFLLCQGLESGLPSPLQAYF